MADKEISQLANLAVADFSGGVLFIVVDPNDTPPSSGTDKNATLSDLSDYFWTPQIQEFSVPGATPSFDTDGAHRNIVDLLGLDTDITSLSSGLSGSPADKDLLLLRFLDNGTPVGITYGASFTNSTQTAPITTVAGVLLRVLFEYDGQVTDTWVCIGSA